MIAFRCIAGVAALLALGSGCGYRFAAGGGTLPEDVKIVRSPIFVNHTAEPALGLVFTRALRDQLIGSGVAADSSAEAELRGEVLNVWGGPTLITSSAVGGAPRLASYRIFAAAKLRLVKGDRVLAETEVVGSEDYLPGIGDVLESEANREAALHRLAQRLMRDAWDRLLVR